MIVDVFMFNDEFDMLACRMYELDGVVDRFVALEGNLTMSGVRKPYRLSDAGLRDDRLMVVPVDLADISSVQGSTSGNVGRYGDYWKRDWKQRAAATDVLALIPGDPVVIYGDVDEIPRREVVASFSGEPRGLLQDLLVYGLGWTGGQVWHGSVIGHRGDLATYPEVRRGREGFPVSPDGGWHMTWFGGEEAVLSKVAMFAHGELAEDPDRMRWMFRDKIRPGTGKPLSRYDGDLPRWVTDGHAPSSWALR